MDIFLWHIETKMKNWFCHMTSHRWVCTWTYLILGPFQHDSANLKVHTLFEPKTVPQNLALIIWHFCGIIISDVIDICSSWQHWSNRVLIKVVRKIRWISACIGRERDSGDKHVNTFIKNCCDKADLVSWCLPLLIEKPGTNPIKILRRKFYATLIFKHTDWLINLRSQSECSKN